MGRLKQLPNRLGALPSRIAGSSPAPGADRSRQRDATVPWRAWYKTAKWQRLRWSILERDLFACQMCRRVDGNTSQLVADHRQPHRGDAALFWNPENLQCLCKRCHDKHKQAIERASGF